MPQFRGCVSASRVKILDHFGLQSDQNPSGFNLHPGDYIFIGYPSSNAYGILNPTLGIVGKQNRLLTLKRKLRETDKPDELEHVVMAINDLQKRAAADINKQRQAELKYRTVADFTYVWEY